MIAFFFMLLLNSPFFQVVQLWVLKSKRTVYAEILQTESGLLSTRKPSTREISDITEVGGSKTKSCCPYSSMWGSGFVHGELLLQRQSFNQKVYEEILWCMLFSVHEKRQELWQDKLWLLYHNKAPAHNALNIQQFLAKKHPHTGTTSLFTWSCSVELTFSPSSKRIIIMRTHFKGLAKKKGKVKGKMH